MMSRRNAPEAPSEEGAPAWMNTYGDMVTLLLTFFVLLFTVSTIDAQKWQEIVQSFTGQRIVAIAPLDPGEPQEGDADLVRSRTPPPTPEPTPFNIEKDKDDFSKLFQSIKVHIVSNSLDAQLNVHRENQVIILHITESALFDSGKDAIRQDARELLSNIVEIFDEYEGAIELIQIEGHTDNVPIHSARFESNWELSTSRAVKVVKYFLEHSSIEPMKYAASGYGEYRPIAANDSEEGKAKNRRVDFVIRELVA